MNIDLRQTVLDNCSYGLYIVTSHSGGKLNGQISDALMQITAFPPRVAVSINKTELTHEYISKSGNFAVSILGKTADLPFIGLFGFKSGRDIDKLSQVQYKIGKNGCPITLENTVAAFEVKVFESVDLGTHTLFIGDVIEGEIIDDETEVLTYRYYQQYLKGKTPKNSPSYHENAKPIPTKNLKNKKYICDVCGYIYDPALGDPDNGIVAGTEFSELPDDWVCPICGVGKDQFTKSH